jgi:serine/threonine protein kinase
VNELSDGAVERLRAARLETLDGRFEILGEAGTGGMGTVYRARDLESGALVAVKVLSTAGGDVRRFAVEADILAHLDHPGIVAYVAHGATAEGEPYLVMEWLEGASLSHELERRALGMHGTLVLGEQVADALQAAHRAGVIHRDMKPSNLFLCASQVERVKILDFGVARLSGGKNLTRSGQIIGTPGYMAPEQARGLRDSDERADIFSLACVLYRCLSGKPAFEGSDVLAVLAQLALHDPPPLGRVVLGAPPALEKLIASMLSKDRDARPASAGEVSVTLAAIRRELEDDGAAATARAPTPLGQTKPLPKSEPRPPRDPPPGPPRGDAGEAPPEAVPASTLHRSTPRLEGRPEPRTTPRSPARWWLLGAALVAVLATAVFMAVGRHSPTREVTEVSSAEPPSPIPSAFEADAERITARACRTWAEALASGQRPDGGFGVERHRTPSGWTTGQHLLGLALSHHTCRVPGQAPLVSGLQALSAARLGGGWGGPVEVPRAETPATAWVVLALTATITALDRKDLVSRVSEGRDLLLAASQPDGGFRFLPAAADGTSNGYSTLLAYWALVEAEPLGAGGDEQKARRAAGEWLRRALREDVDDPPLRSVAGLAEQTTWVLLRGRTTTDDERPDDDELLRESARAIVARCALSAPPVRSCTRPIYEDGQTYLDKSPGKPPNLVTLWHPWVTLASHALAHDTTITLPPELRAELQQIARWGLGQTEPAIPLLTAAPGYKLAEYLTVVSLLAAQAKKAPD